MEAKKTPGSLKAALETATREVAESPAWLKTIYARNRAIAAAIKAPADVPPKKSRPKVWSEDTQKMASEMVENLLMALKKAERALARSKRKVAEKQREIDELQARRAYGRDGSGVRSDT